MQFTKLKKQIIFIVSIILCSFHLYTGIFGLLVSLQQRSIHVGLSIFLILLLYSNEKLNKKNNLFNFISKFFNLFLIISILISSGYIFLNYLKFLPFLGNPINQFEMIIAILTVIVILESARRTIGYVFPLITFLVIMYALWGHYIPGFLMHAYLRPKMIFEYIYLSPNAIWGFITGLSATYISLFIIFGSFLLSAGGGQTLMELSLLVAGRFKGGPAKVAVFASGMLAMLSGSSIANVATTGSFTIPLMKRLGYSPEFAAAVESVASTGGMVTPPVMGAAIFIMAEFLGISYLKVCIAAAIPAFFYYLSVFLGVHFEAVRLKLKPVPESELPKVKDVFVFKKIFSLFMPIGVLFYTLFKGYSLTLVSASACIAVLITYVLSDFSVKGILERFKKLPKYFENAGQDVAKILPIMVCANIILFLLDLTGLSPKFSSWAMNYSGNNLGLTFILTAVIVMILGCGLPTTAAYVIGVAVAAPQMIKLGINPIAAHLFIVYYATLATITPPVCPTVFVASTIAKSNWLKTAFISVRLVPLIYILPFLFIYDNSFILIGSLKDILINIPTAIVGLIIMTSGITKQLLVNCNFIESVALIGAGFLLIISGLIFDLVGFFIFLIIFINQVKNIKSKKLSY